MRISDWSSDVCSSDLGGGGAQHQPEGDADQRQCEDLRHVDLEDEAAWRAKALQGGDGGGLALQVAADGVADADAADQQGRQPDQREEEAQPGDEADDAGRRPGGGAESTGQYGRASVGARM